MGECLILFCLLLCYEHYKRKKQQIFNKKAIRTAHLFAHSRLEVISWTFTSKVFKRVLVASVLEGGP